MGLVGGVSTLALNFNATTRGASKWQGGRILEPEAEQMHRTSESGITKTPGKTEYGKADTDSVQRLLLSLLG